MRYFLILSFFLISFFHTGFSNSKEADFIIEYQIKNLDKQLLNQIATAQLSKSDLSLSPEELTEQAQERFKQEKELEELKKELLETFFVDPSSARIEEILEFVSSDLYQKYAPKLNSFFFTFIRSFQLKMKEIVKPEETDSVRPNENDSSFTSSKQLDFIIENKIDNLHEGFLTEFATGMLRNSNLSLTPEELVRQTKESLKQEKSLKQALIRALDVDISSPEMDEICDFVSSELYQKYAPTLELSNMFLSSMISLKMFDILSEAMKPEISNVIDLDNRSFEEVVNNSEYLVLDVYTTWCPPCKMLAPIIDKCSTKFPEKHVFAKVNAETYPDLIKSLNIKAFPTLIFFRNGQEIERHTGFLSEESLTQKIKEYFN